MQRTKAMRPARLLFAAWLATVVAGAGPEAISAAESGMVVQDLVTPKASGKVNAAYWTLQEDSYTLQMLVPPFFIGNTIACLRGLDPTFGTGTSTRATTSESQPPVVNVAEALQHLVPRNISTYMPVLVEDGSAVPGDFRALARQPKTVQVWLLRADGTQVLPTMRSAYPSQDTSCSAMRARRFDDEITYRFPVIEGEQAVAVAIRIDDDYYIEKLQPLRLRQ